jgi:hypothetical protein
MPSRTESTAELDCYKLLGLVLTHIDKNAAFSIQTLLTFFIQSAVESDLSRLQLVFVYAASHGRHNPSVGLDGMLFRVVKVYKQGRAACVTASQTRYGRYPQSRHNDDFRKGKSRSTTVPDKYHSV